MQKDTKRSPVVSFRIGWDTIGEMKKQSLIKEDYSTSDLNSVVKQIFFDNIGRSAKTPINTDFLQRIEDTNSINYQLMRLRLFDAMCDLEAENYLRIANAIAKLEKMLKNNIDNIQHGNYNQISDEDRKEILKLKKDISTENDSNVFKEVCCYLSVISKDFVEYLTSI
jgi:hypothetical protein